MNEAMRIIGIVGAAWLLLSIVIAVAWGLAGRRIFRRPPQPPIDNVRRIGGEQ